MLPDPRDKPLLNVDEDLVPLGLFSRGWWFAHIASGEIPSLRYGRRIFVPTAALRRQWGLDPDREAA